ncbi:hypothetical protein [Aneurinibacillus migulanus]|uniref:Uncharacterized protein n=1 Tax=Aneurinibacillus migulanus TaxID=47500 RepID=A0A0D1X626_ANEMI|nr:hypothetical protein [Aneurinibacillus migulanus]KIV49981.1 hypothetical protein TS65_31090 [Aneurinibacillus migulanus]KON97778.1 hypothetical protein AF333_22430 [Aneurinibacillus migulanus]MED0894640.1 hypothetical protein [Aneurinibacillus migulanus]MED1619371.1 hypothetical protein [Aneurinibacillus migulanus]
MEKEEGGYALRPGRKKADVSFSARSRPPPFLLFLSLTTRICRFIKSDVYSLEYFVRIKLDYLFMSISEDAVLRELK